MKKLILFALLAMAIPASAASINWTIATGGDANFMVNSDKNKVTGMAYLILTSDMSEFSSKTDIEKVALGSAEITDGINKTQQTATSTKLTAPTEYEFSLVVFDSVKSEYFVADTTKTKAAYNLGADLDHYGTATSITFNAKDVHATSALQGTQTYHSVPEPSVALMGLLGLGMLLKRRRA